MIPFKKKYFFHLVAILLYLMLPMLLIPRPKGEPFFLITLPLIRDLIAGIMMLTFFYTNYYFFVPNIYLRKKYILYIGLVVGGFVLIILSPSMLTGHIPFSSKPAWIGEIPGMMVPRGNDFLISISHNILLFITTVAFSIFLRTQEHLYKVEEAKNQMEIHSLKEQINPHFLFNTLNNIYGQAIESNSPKAASNILKLSGMLRHVVHDAQQQWVSLKKELDYIENYIQLQRQRLSKGVELNYMTKGEGTESQKIAPLILIPFIENAFKHGVDPNKESFIKIVISLNEESINLQVENSIANIALQTHEESGAGLRITQKRLQMLYPHKHDLQIAQDDDRYLVNLNIELND